VGLGSAEKEYKRAIVLYPGYATAHHWYAWHLIVTGRISEGIAQLKTAESLDPLSLIISATWRMHCASLISMTNQCSRVGGH